MSISEKDLYNRILEAQSEAKESLIEVYCSYTKALNEIVPVTMAYQKALYEIERIANNGTNYKELVSKLQEIAEDALVDTKLRKLP